MLLQVLVCSPNATPATVSIPVTAATRPVAVQIDTPPRRIEIDGEAWVCRDGETVGFRGTIQSELRLAEVIPGLPNRERLIVELPLLKVTRGGSSDFGDTSLGTFMVVSATTARLTP